MIWYFLFFLVSGFCGILYEIVWLRLAMAQFGVTNALVSIVLSIFMAGLGLGSWGSGRLVRRYGYIAGAMGLRLYAVAELLIGVSALVVPLQLHWGHLLLENAGVASSGTYYLASGVWIALTMIPWCACMGATIPLAMESIKTNFRGESPSSFSYLYLANVIGAATGAILPLLLIELYGFRGTLRVGAALNGALALSAFALSTRVSPAQETDESRIDIPEPTSQIELGHSPRPLILLFATGLTSMGLEVVWIRQFTPYLGTMVYAFAAILAMYLISTLIGSKIYRLWNKKRADEPALIWLGLGFCGLLSLVAGDPQFRMLTVLRPILGIAPFSMVLGFLTPMLVDRWSGGDPDRAGTAYATNVVGCILGPLLSGFLLLPHANEHWVICIFAFPWLAFGFIRYWLTGDSGRSAQRLLAYTTVLLALALAFTSKNYESQFPNHVVRRDSTATVVAATINGDKRLLVNGVGMTVLHPVTKLMAHVPMASLNHSPQKALAICFGMGTTFRSLLSWGVPTTAVELVPDVPRMFGYYHSDAPQLLRSHLARVVIDDGRRFLERSSEQYDVITIDPPPPVEAAGSSMLYSKEFYTVINKRLKEDGILQQWLPGGDDVVRSAVARALSESFPYVRAFEYLPNGYSFLASRQPILRRTGADLVQRMPESAVRDLMEWPLAATPQQELDSVLQKEKTVAELAASDPETQAMRDDQPVNEYVLLRHLKAGTFHTTLWSLSMSISKVP